MIEELKDISGAKGKGGGGGGSSGAKEDPNTLQSRAVVRVLEVISEGEIVGLATEDGQSIYFDNTPIQNSDGSYNFSSVGYDYRVGLPSQSYMPGFPSAEAVTQINTVLTAASPITVQVSNPDIDAVRITVQLPQGLSLQDTKNGNLHGSEVAFRIEKKLDSTGIWLNAGEPIISGKTTSPYEVDYRIDRPSGSGLWTWRITRLTPDATKASVHDQSAVSRYTEIEDVKLEYNYTAYMGVAVDAQSTGNTIPTRAYLVKGIICQVPSNYDAYARTYTGQWNGTFKRSWTSNPAWVLYDLLTNERYGLGEFFGSAYIDKFSFYQAAVYNDEQVSIGTTTEPRFTFNGVIAAQDDALKVLQAVAGSMRAVLMYSGGMLWLNQDRPSSPVRLVTNANVIDGTFDRMSTPLQSRHSVARVTWNDPSNKYAATITTVEDANAIQKFGYFPKDVAAYGATSEGQAIRAGRWILDTENTQTEVITYKSSFEQFDLRVGDVIKVWDEKYTMEAGGGRIVSASGQTVVLDRAVTLAPGSKIEVQMSDGTIANLPIAQTSGTRKTITVVGEWPMPLMPNAVYCVFSAIHPKQYRVSVVTTEDNVVNVTAIQYDEGKYARIEQGIVLEQSPYSKVQLGAIAPVENVASEQESYKDELLGTVLGLRIKWDNSTTQGVNSYLVKWSYNGGEYNTATTYQNTYLISNATAGTYKVVIYAVHADGRKSRGTTATFDNSYSGSSSLEAVAAVTIVPGFGSGNVFTGNHLYVQWDKNLTNEDIPGATVGGYLVEVFNASTGNLLRAETVSQNTLTYDYTYDKNLLDGGPNRSLRIDVYTLDAYNRPSANHATGTFTNEAPQVPANINTSSLTGAIMISYDKPDDSDYAGVLIWLGTSAGFTLSQSNLAFEGDSSLVTISGLDPTVTYRMRLAAYDTFGKSYDGAGLHLSGEYSIQPYLDTGIPPVSSLPSTGVEGQFVYNTTDERLYYYSNGAWAPAVSTDALTGQIVSTQIADNAITTPKLYTGSVVADKIAVGAVTASKIAANSVSADKITANAIGTSHLQASAVNADKIAANVINSGHLRTDTLVVTTSAQIASLTVDTLHIKNNAITVAAAGSFGENQLKSFGSARIWTYYAQTPQSVSIIADYWVWQPDYGNVYFDVYVDGSLVARRTLLNTDDLYGNTMAGCAMVNVSLGAGSHYFDFYVSGSYAINWSHTDATCSALILGALK